MMQGKISLGAFFRDALAEATSAGLPGIDARFFPGMMEAMAGGETRPLMVRTLRRLRAAGVRTCALTNNFSSEPLADPAAQAEAEREHAKFVALFDGFIESVVVGHTKPDPEMYRMALAGGRRRCRPGRPGRAATPNRAEQSRTAKSDTSLSACVGSGFGGEAVHAVGGTRGVLESTEQTVPNRAPF